MRNRLAFTIAAGIALLAGCSTPSNHPAPAPAGTTSPTPAAAVPRSADDALASRDARLTVTGVHLEHLPGIDRVVYELGGTGAPGWQVRYVGQPLQDGSGTPVEVAGTSILEVRILGSAYPWDSLAAEYDGPDPVTDPAVPGIAGVYGTQVYEGVTQSFIGVRADRPAYTVTGDPARLVVDITTA
ncbi:hypothetical protein [Nocardia sp. alder85J]|uniref:AMIN-like domain-containing (lipo)protein n=1 Tax=Nocardia sp. alder85J TaxID=2862949 RepID=UPI001CD711C5|nr:hypothetical protein [Nocardia sp. alder85J]MCX4096139.1 hypothetical protein [Nocardia sp. alder85J]